MIGSAACAGHDVLMRRARLLLAQLILLCLAGMAQVQAAAASEPIKIISHAEQGEAELDRALLRALFMLRMRQWPDGATVHVFVMAEGSDIHDQFCRERLGTYPYVLRSAWDRIVYTGMGLGPTTVRSEEEMIARVRSTPGGIGYIRHRSSALVTGNLSLRALLSAGLTYE
jgi:ABC-type phosphate transport system substrate-binding protein